MRWGVSDENLAIVRQGMRLVAQSGTASDFANYGVAIGAKTGTAQVTGHSDNVTFIGFAPYDDPEIAIAVVLEHGDKSTYSKAIARDLFDAYFYGAYVDEKGEVVVPSAADTPGERELRDEGDFLPSFYIKRRQDLGLSDKYIKDNYVYCPNFFLYICAEMTDRKKRDKIHKKHFD